jgi:hypothetical protein
LRDATPLLSPLCRDSSNRREKAAVMGRSLES